MSRVFKGSKFRLKLFVPSASEVSNLKISLFTTDYQIAYTIEDGLKVDGDIVSLIVDGDYLTNMADGLIKYIAEGDSYLIERQSNYFLKNPSAMGGSDLIEITEIFPLNETTISLNGADYNVDGFSKIIIDATDALDHKLREGLATGEENGIQIGIEQQKSKLEEINILENGIYEREDGYSRVIVEIPESEQTEELELVSASLQENGTFFPRYNFNAWKLDNVALKKDVYFFINPNYTELQLTVVMPEDYLTGKGTIFGCQNSSDERTTFKAYYENGILYLQLGEYKADFPLEKRNGRIITVALAFNTDIFYAGVQYGISTYYHRQYIRDANFNAIEGMPIYIGSCNVDGFPQGTFKGHIRDGFFHNEHNYVDIGTEDYGDGPFLSFGGLRMDTTYVETGDYYIAYENIDYNYDGYSAVVVNIDTNSYYDEGYNNGVEAGKSEKEREIINSAESVKITQNGKYAVANVPNNFDDAVKGVFDDGTEFKNCALLGGTAFDTGIFTDENTKVEIWYKPKEMADYYGLVIGAQSGDDSEDTFQLRHTFSVDDYWAKIGYNGEVGYSDYNRGWHHFEMSYADGFIVDGNLIQSFRDFGSPNITGCPNTLLINGTKNMDQSRCANGYFGMVKINDQIFIPTEDGFKNHETGELLERFFVGDYQYIEYIEGEQTEIICQNLIKEITVDVSVEGTVESDVLEVTENGFYLTPYTRNGDYEISKQTGINDDGTPFFGYAQLIEAVYDTGIPPTPTTTLELWWKNDAVSPSTTVVGAQYDDATSIFKVMEGSYDGGEIYAEIQGEGITCSEYNKNGWNHIKLSYANGFWVNGVHIGNFSSNVPYVSNGNILINHNGTNFEGAANGYYGMIKINDTTFIPTEQGWLNSKTGEYLNAIVEGSYTYGENNSPTVVMGENYYRTIKVNVTDPNVNCDEAYDEGFNLGYEYGNEFGYNRGYEDGNSNGYYDGYANGRNDVVSTLKPINITENGVYDLREKTYFYMDDDIFPLCQYNTTDYCRVVFKVFEGGCWILGGNVQSPNSVGIYAIDRTHIKVRWMDREGTYEIKEDEWNTVDLQLGSVLINGAEFETSTSNYSTPSETQLYIGCYDGIGPTFLFNELSYWKVPEDYFANNTPDYYATPYECNVIKFTLKDGSETFVNNVNETASVCPETEGQNEYGWNKITVNVGGKAKLPNGIKFSNSSINGEFPDIFDFSEVTNFSSMFSTITGMTSIPMIDTSQATSMGACFEYCRFLTTIPKFNTSKNKNMYKMFKECERLESIPKLDTSNVTSWDECFWGCKKLTTLPQLDTSKATSLYNTFFNCTGITTLPALDCSSLTNGNNISDGLDNLVTFGGWQNLRTTAYIDNLKKLSYNSVVNIIDGLYDFEKSYAVQSLYVSAEFIETASGNISRATRKGWEIREW